MNRPPTILFMGRIFEDTWGGVREMAESLLRAAAPICEEQGRRVKVLVPREGMCPVRSKSIGEVILPRFGGNRILWDHWTVPNFVNHCKFSVLYNIKLILPERLRIPGFTTVHDLMYFPLPHKYGWREYTLGDSLYMRTMLPRTVRRAPMVHCDSNYTAEDAREIFPDADPNMFRPLHLGVEAERYHPDRTTPEDDAIWDELKKMGLREPYILQAGSLSRRKNVRVLAAAFERFQRRFPDFQLVITGGSAPTTGDPKLQRYMNMIPRGKLARLGRVGSRGMELLYQRADFFVFPSLYEGFGLPVLEAQAAGCPVICADATSLPEVARDAALYFDPNSPGDLVRKMTTLTDQKERDRLRTVGMKNAESFTWEKTAQKWLELADEAYNTR